jgi:hypothetical protein
MHRPPDWSVKVTEARPRRIPYQFAPTDGEYAREVPRASGGQAQMLMAGPHQSAASGFFRSSRVIALIMSRISRRVSYSGVTSSEA